MEATPVERAEEFETLRRLIDAGAEGHGCVALIEGPAGIGKSLLLLEARRHAAGHDLLTLTARGSELEREFPFGIVRQLYEGLVADPQRRERVLAGAAAPAAAVFGAIDAAGAEASGDASFAALHGLFWLTLNLAAEGPVVLAIDDLQWCDLASLRFIAYLARRLEGVPVPVIATVRTGETPTDPTLLADISHEPSTTVVRPGPLSVDGVEELVRKRLGADAAPEFCAACWSATGGNPLLLLQLLTALADDHVKPDAASVSLVEDIGPRAVSRSVLLRLARLRGEAVTVARAVAILGDSADLPAVAALAGIDESRVAEATSSLARAEILQAEPPIGFVHPLVREAVYRELPPGERELQHWRAARALNELGAAPEQISSHLLAISRRGDAWVTETLHAAGSAAMRRGAADSAIAYLRRALDEAPSGVDDAPLLLELGLAEGMTNLGAALEHLKAAHEGLTDPAARALAANALSRILLFASPPDALHLTQTAVAELAGTDDPALQDMRLAIEATGFVAWWFAGAREPAVGERLVELGRSDLGPAPGAKMVKAVSAYYAAATGGHVDECVAIAQDALADDTLIRVENGLLTVFATNVLVIAGSDEAIEFFDRARADAHQRGSLFAIAAVHLWRGWTLLQRGDLEDAEDALSRALDESVSWGHTFALLWPSAYLSAVLRERGDLDGARRALARGGPLNATQGAQFWLESRGELDLIEGRHEDAIAAAEGIGQRLDMIVNPAYTPWRSLKARALDALGRTDEAIALVEEELVHARAWGAPATVGRALRILGTLKRDDGIVDLEEAAVLLARSPAKLEHAKALAALGSALRHARKLSDAREPLRAALELADQCGATALADHVRSELYATGARPRTDALSGVGALTASERRVADLAVNGLTNRDIAQALFVTPKTVEVHLSSAYRKLGIKSRRDLPAALEPQTA